MHLSAVGDLESRPLAWLWPGRLALGKLAMLDGDPGLGKSLVTLDLCARLSRGRPFPDGKRPLPGFLFVFRAASLLDGNLPTVDDIQLRAVELLVRPGGSGRNRR